jgi:hypothetical protein
LKRVKNILYQPRTDISTPENADKVINLTANKGGADLFIAGGADENKFSLSGTCHW